MIARDLFWAKKTPKQNAMGVHKDSLELSTMALEVDVIKIHHLNHCVNHFQAGTGYDSDSSSAASGTTSSGAFSAR